MTDPFETDHFMDLVAGATGKVYPSPGAMRYANSLVKMYSEEMVAKAIRKAMKDGAGHHEVLGRAEEMLKYASERRQMGEEDRKTKELEQARLDRNRRATAEQERLEKEFVPVAPERVSELMGDWQKKVTK